MAHLKLGENKSPKTKKISFSSSRRHFFIDFHEAFQDGCLKVGVLLAPYLTFSALLHFS